MGEYIDLFVRSFTGYAKYLFHSITHPNLHSYFYWLIALSLLVWILELAKPWRKNQKAFRKDFWLDFFYMFFNFFIFSLIGYNALSDVVSKGFDDLWASLGIRNLVAIQLGNLPYWSQLLLMFVIRDFVQWNAHRTLHRYSFLWKFHQLHHSVKEMGFAAHLRYHWGETIFYRVFEYLPLGLIGFSVEDFIIVHIIAIFIGHINHSNIQIDYGIFKYVFNNPKMHIWHHAKHLPHERRFGVNFGLSLSCWDYLFKTNYIPYDGRDIELGFEEDEKFPDDFIHQMTYPLEKK